jgi:hypothetical protein
VEDQPEHSAGVRPTEGNIPAHLSHRPERTTQALVPAAALINGSA